MLHQISKKISGILGDLTYPTQKLDTDKGYHLFSDLLPYRFFDDESELFINKNSIGFALEVTPLVGADEKTIDTLTGMITDGLPSGCTIQFLNWASPNVSAWFKIWENSRKKQGGIYSKIAEKRQQHFNSANFNSLFRSASYTIKNFRLFIIGSMPINTSDQGGIAKIINYIKANQKDVNTSKIILDITALKEKLISTLHSIKMSSVVLKSEGLIELLSEIINIHPYKINEEVTTPDYNPLDPINNQIFHPENILKIHPDYLSFWEGDKEMIAKTMSLVGLPQIWAGWQCRDLIGDFFSDYKRMEEPFLTSFSLTVPEDESKSIDHANYKNFRTSQALSGDLAKYSPFIKEEAADWQFVAHKVNSGQKLFQVIYQVIVFAQKNKINKAEQTIKSIYKTYGWSLVADKYITLQSFLATMPFNLSEGLIHDLKKLNRTRTMVSWNCANLAPFQAEWKGGNSPCMFLFGRRGQPFFWDPFQSPTNYNVAVVGTTGSGKSVFMQDLVVSIRGMGGKVYVIDDGRSFMNSCLIQGGEFIEFKSANICINPFSIVNEKNMTSDKEYKEEVINLVKAIVKQMCRSTGQVTDFENGLIEEAVVDVWNRHESKANITMVRDYFALHKDERARDLGVMMKAYTKEGIYGRFFDGKANIELKNPLMLFELAELKNKKELQAIVMMFLMFLVSENMYFGDRETPIVILIDEAWDLLHGEGSKNFIEGLARRARKYKGSLVTGTQTINDYYKNSATIATIENSASIILLTQSKEAVEALFKTEKIVGDENLKKILKSLTKVDGEYSEALIYTPSGYAVGRLILDSYSYALYSSKAEDWTKIKNLRKQGYSLEDALETISNQS